MRCLLIFVAAVLLFAAPANAVTIQTGKAYIGDYSFAGAIPQAASCCPVVSIDGPIGAQQYNISFGPDLLDIGETISLRFDFQLPPPVTDPDRNLSEYTATTTTSGLGLGIPSIFNNLTSGKVSIHAFGGSFDISSLEIFGTVSATVSTPSGSLLATELGIATFVTNIRELTPPPPPTTVPLPASALFLLSGLAGLGTWRRVKRSA